MNGTRQNDNRPAILPWNSVQWAWLLKLLKHGELRHGMKPSVNSLRYFYKVSEIAERIDWAFGTRQICPRLGRSWDANDYFLIGI